MAQATKQREREREPTTYNFGPLERRGLLAGLTSVQVLTLFIAGVLAVGLLSVAHNALLAALILAVATALAFFKRQGQPLVHRLGIVWLYWARRATGKTQWRSSAPQQGFRVRFPITDGEARPEDAEIVSKPHDLPDAVAGIEILETAYGASQKLGVVKDPTVNGYAAAFVMTTDDSFPFDSRETQEHKLSRWGAWMAGTARTGVFSRFQWIDRTVVSANDDIVKWFEENRVHSDDSRAIQSYKELLQYAGSASREHELILVLQIRNGNPAISQRLKRHGRDDAGLCHVLSVEAREAIQRLERAGIASARPLSADALAASIKDAYDPYRRPDRRRLIDSDPDRDGISPELAWPLGADETAQSYRTDSALHRTMCFGEWPRLNVEPGFLSPLLLQTEGIRAVSVVMEPVIPRRSIRKAEQAVHQDVTDEAIRSRFGFLPTARRKREQQTALKREEQLVQGHAEIRLAGFLTVSVPAEQEDANDALDTASAAVQDAAQLSLLEPDSRPGEQAQAFACGALPLCRGI